MKELPLTTEGECGAFLKKLLNIELDDATVKKVWEYINAHTLTPLSKHGGNNIAFTPKMVMDLASMSLRQSIGTVESPQYKKFREEIFPAVIFVIALKKAEQGEYLLAFGDVPDIILIPRHQERTRPQIKACPTEALFLTKEDIENSGEKNYSEKIVNIIVEKKFKKSYVSETTLLVSLIAGNETFNLEEIKDLLPKNNYHQIWMLIAVNQDAFIVACVSPELVKIEISTKDDIVPLIY